MFILIVFSYGVLVALGGWIGYLQAGSALSAIMGTLMGGLVIICAALMRRHNRLGLLGTRLLSVSLMLFFMTRFIKTEKLMPGFWMAVISFLVLIYSYYSKERNISKFGTKS